MPSLLQTHVDSWKNCKRCPLYKTRKNVVICRGTIPSDVLFCGEGPGESEDILGMPFVGPAGKLLDRIILKVEKEIGETVSKCWTNLVACIPKLDTPQRIKTEPLPAEIASCYPRLDEFISICAPRLIIAVGDLAKKYGLKEQHWELRAKVVSIVHPSAILQSKVSQGMMIQRTEIALRDAFRDMLCPF